MVIKHRLKLLLLLSVLVLSFQCLKIGRPFSGHFASYQTVMSSMARNMVRENFTDLLHPKTNLLFNGQRSLHLNQYPASSLLTALLVKTTKGSYEFWGRAHSLFFHLLSLLFLWQLLRKRESEDIAFMACALYLLSGLSIIYSQMFMSEYLAQFSFIAALYFAYSNPAMNNRNTVLSALFLSVAIVNRIHYVLFGLVFLPGVLSDKFPEIIKKALLFAFFSLVLPVLWYGYTYFAALKSDHMHTSLFMQLAVKGAPKTAGLYFAALKASFKTVFFYMLNPLIFVFFIWGAIGRIRQIKSDAWIYTGLFSTFFLILLFPQKVIDQDFYLLPVHFFVAVLTAQGISLCCAQLKKHQSIFIAILIALSAAYGFRVALHPVYTIPQNERADINFMRQTAGLIPENAKVVLMGNSHPVAAYYLNRPFFFITPDAAGTGLEEYRRSSQFQGLTDRQIEAETLSRSTVLNWLNRSEKEGAEYLLIFPEIHPEALNTALLSHLRNGYQLILTENAYQLYQRQKS